MEDNFESGSGDLTQTDGVDLHDDVIDGADSGQDSGNEGISSFGIPEEYKEKDWVKDFEGKTVEELKGEIFKRLDEKYSNMPVVPQTVEEYALKELEFKDEDGNVKYEYPEEVLGIFSNEFKELGLTKEQAHGLLSKYTDFELEQFQNMTDANELNHSIDEMFKTNPAQKQTVQGLLKEFLPPEDQKFLQDTAPNVTIQMFYKVAKGLVDKYGYKEGAGAQSLAGNYKMTQEDKDREYERIVGEMEALQRRQHTSEEKEALQKQLDNLFA